MVVFINFVVVLFLSLAFVSYVAVIYGNAVRKLFDKSYQFCVASVFAQEIILAFALRGLGYSGSSSDILLVCRHQIDGWIYLVTIADKPYTCLDNIRQPNSWCCLLVQLRTAEGDIHVQKFTPEVLSYVTSYWASRLDSSGLWECLEQLYYTYTHPVADDILDTMAECGSWDLEVFVAAAEFDDV
jgi:Kef-type K+ transport system membrane component KefB